MRIKNHTLTLLLGASLFGCATEPPAPSTTSATPAAAPAAVVVTPPAAPPTPAAVKNMVSNCFSCHGTDGRSAGSIPSLTGINAQQALVVLQGFKSGALPSTVMTRHAKGYTDAELEAIANYIGTNLK
jgi:cytochrome subunit of sulfide dehydrogenase